MCKNEYVVNMMVMTRSFSYPSRKQLTVCDPGPFTITSLITLL